MHALKHVIAFIASSLVALYLSGVIGEAIAYPHGRSPYDPGILGLLHFLFMLPAVIVSYCLSIYLYRRYLPSQGFILVPLGAVFLSIASGVIIDFTLCAVRSAQGNS